MNARDFQITPIFPARRRAALALQSLLITGTTLAGVAAATIALAARIFGGL